MEKKCSAKKHSEITAIYYCQDCKKFLCNKCQNLHSELIEEHQLIKLEKNTIWENIFTGYCKENSHINKLEYFCKTHNKLCCIECICKIKDETRGYHSDCEVCKIENIINEKKDKLKDNIKCLEELLKILESSMNEIRKTSEKINEDKEKAKLNIQNIFTKIRNVLNEKEEELLKEIDEKYDKLFLTDNVIKESEKLPDKVKISLEKGKKIDKEWDNNKINLMINGCINIENHISDINSINTKFKNCNLNYKNDINFSINEELINLILKNIKTFSISQSFKFKWKSGPNYTLSNNDLIATKTSGGSAHNCNILGDIILPKNRINRWKIKLKKFTPQDYQWTILVGVGPSDLNQNEGNPYNHTWTFLCGYSKISIKSGSPSDYNGHNGQLKEGDIVEVIMNTINGELSFSINGVNYGIACRIPLDIELSPFVNIYHQGESIELLN